MTSVRQIDANRRNALQSTGPTTQSGKNHSRRNAIRHGLCAETVITAIEDIDDYRDFEKAVIADYDVTTAVERELALRLASLLWRLRRATSIETGLLQAHAESLLEKDQLPQLSSNGNGVASKLTTRSQTLMQNEITRCFLHLAGADQALVNVSRYETALWRQLRQTLFTLNQQQRGKSLTRSKRAWWKSIKASSL
jgi:hypothetical protein